MEEVWRPIRDFEASHEVSNFGRVRTIPRSYIGVGYWGTRCIRTIRYRVISQRTNANGYAVVSYSADKRKAHRLVHRVVAEAFHGPRPSSCHEVNHIDGDKLNNRADNLEWVTPSENSQHAYDTGLRRPNEGSQVWTAKLSDRKVSEIRTLLREGRSFRSLAKRYGVTPPQISRIASGKAWKHVA